VVKMTETNEPRIRVKIKRIFPYGPESWEYVNLKDLKICGKITERGLEEHSHGGSIVFEREDVALEGRLYLRAKNGEYLDHSHIISRRNRRKYIVTPDNGHHIQCPWNKVKSGLAVRNKLHDNWDIYLKSGDKLTFIDGKEFLKRYEFVLAR